MGGGFAAADRFRERGAELSSWPEEWPEPSDEYLDRLYDEILARIEEAKQPQPVVRARKLLVATLSGGEVMLLP